MATLPQKTRCVRVLARYPHPNRGDRGDRLIAMAERSLCRPGLPAMPAASRA
jgi:hypothetical protein